MVQDGCAACAKKLGEAYRSDNLRRPPVRRPLPPEWKSKPFVDMARDMAAFVDLHIAVTTVFHRERGFVVTMTLGERKTERTFHPHIVVAVYQESVLEMAEWLVDDGDGA